MRALSVLAIVAAIAVAGCEGGNEGQFVSRASTVHSLTGTWVGAAADSSGSLMGAGMSPATMVAMTWTLTQSGTTFSGTALFPGYQGGMANIVGRVSDHAATFTMTLPPSSMTIGMACSAIAQGSFDMDDKTMELHGTFSGTNSCSGPFDQGKVSMVRR